MKKLKLTGKHAVGEREYALISDEDFEECSKYAWNLKLDKRRNYYFAIRNTRPKVIHLSRFVMRVTDSKIFVDHINHNTLDNRRENLRITNQANNAKNQTSHKNSTSSFLGVCLYKPGKWKASILGKLIGYYDNEIYAAEAYDIAAIQYHKEFANLNFKYKMELYKERLKTDNPYNKKRRNKTSTKNRILGTY